MMMMIDQSDIKSFLRLANWEAASTICYTVYCIQYLQASYLNRTDTTATACTDISYIVYDIRYNDAI
jgi:hypothetical protein